MGNEEDEVMSACALDEHPAVRAWAELGERTLPKGVESLKLCDKSATYRLVGVGPGGTSLIAKKARRPTALLERTIYTEILPELPLPCLAFHGFLEDADEGYCWIFLEDAGDVPPASRADLDPVRIARWLAVLHSGAAGLAPTSTLPDRGPDHYLAQLRRIPRVIAEHLDHPDFGSEERETLAEIRDQCDLVESHWGEVEALCSALPCTLVHGDFIAKNLRFRRAGGDQALLVFDWEFSGRATPTADFCASESSAAPLLVDLETYRREVRWLWPGLDRATLMRMMWAGRLLRWAVTSIDWRSQSLATSWLPNVFQDLRIYQRRAARSIRALGWAD